jgi:hypothetical protein
MRKSILQEGLIHQGLDKALVINYIMVVQRKPSGVLELSFASLELSGDCRLMANLRSCTV